MCSFPDSAPSFPSMRLTMKRAHFALRSFIPFKDHSSKQNGAIYNVDDNALSLKLWFSFLSPDQIEAHRLPVLHITLLKRSLRTTTHTIILNNRHIAFLLSMHVMKRRAVFAGQPKLDWFCITTLHNRRWTRTTQPSFYISYCCNCLQFVVRMSCSTKLWRYR